ncbi:MAG: hypothetical protein A3F67_00480 [Verrucomicrobia bacterium RIFCSPHIGHO2_12_FULL_41_10]|nr:MAG: hypothetical protein A3F67_00480 [Verrucomicrobia bacterium RIFCSPHIGHO2_12_FULL_41_10]
MELFSKLLNDDWIASAANFINVTVFRRNKVTLVTTKRQLYTQHEWNLHTAFAVQSFSSDPFSEGGRSERLQLLFYFNLRGAETKYL